MARRILIILLSSLFLVSCSLLEKSTKGFPELKIGYLSTSYYVTKDYRGKDHRVPELTISSNIDIENEALKRNLTISDKDLSCVFDKEILADSGIPSSYRTIEGLSKKKDKLKEDNYWSYKFHIWSTKNRIFDNLPSGLPEKIKDKKDTDTLYCQYVIYFYYAKPIIKSNVIEIPFNEFNNIRNIL